MVDVFYSGDGNGITGLFTLYIVVIIEESHVSKWGVFFTRKHKQLAHDVVDSFGNLFIRPTTANSSTWQRSTTFPTTKCCGLDGLVMCRALEIQFGGEKN